MADWQIVQADVIDWAREYDGPPFHAMLTDCPFELSFMSRSWDSQGISFRPDTWAALAEHLLPGAFAFAFAASRGWHRLACALEDAGLLIQPSVFVESVGVVEVPPMLGWVQGQAFPKSTAIGKAIDKRANAKRKVIGRMSEMNPRYRTPRRGAEGWGSIIASESDPPITAPATPLARAWEGHRYGGQVLKDCCSPIVVAQKPWIGKRLDCIVKTGAGALWVNGGRVGTESTQRTANVRGVLHFGGANHRPHHDEPDEHRITGNTSGRWPPNYAVMHNPVCIPVTETIPCPDCGGDGRRERCERCGGSGVMEVQVEQRVKGIRAGCREPIRGDNIASECKGMYTPGRKGTVWDYADPDGTEPVARFACARYCPTCGCQWLAEDADDCPECGGSGAWACMVRLLNEEAGSRPSSARPNSKGRVYSAERQIYGASGDVPHNSMHTGSGGPSRFFYNPHFWAETAERLALGRVSHYAAKASRAERSSGLERFVWRKQQKGHKRIWSDAAIDQFWHWREESKGLPGAGYDDWLQAQGRDRRKIHHIPYMWGNIHPTVKCLDLDIWLCRLLACPPIYVPRRLLIPFLGSGTELCAAILSGHWDEIVGIDSDPQACEIADARARFWTDWHKRTGSADPKAILKAARKAERMTIQMTIEDDQTTTGTGQAEEVGPVQLALEV